jgi:hypothetical protein
MFFMFCVMLQGLKVQVRVLNVLNVLNAELLISMFFIITNKSTNML